MGASKIENAWNSSVKHKLTTGEILPGFSRFAVACRGGVVVLPSQLLCFLFDISFATFVPRPRQQTKTFSQALKGCLKVRSLDCSRRHIDTHMHTCIHTIIHARARHIHLHGHPCTRTRTLTRTCTLSHTHSRTRRRTRL